MYRSLIVIVLAIVCGLSAAIGVNQLTPPPAPQDVGTTPVFVASQSIGRGKKIEVEDVKSVDWPTDLVPDGIASQPSEIVGRSALAAIAAGEPIFRSKVSDSSGRDFISNSIEPGMRACTIQTSGPSASVAGFVRPDDHVDVLLNLRGSSGDETGGGTALTLLQNIQILATDDNLAINDSAALKLWKEGVKSVTLLVTPEQALQLSLGQAAGTLSLALRNSDDPKLAVTRPLSLTQVRSARPLFAFADVSARSVPEIGSARSPTSDESSSPDESEPEPSSPTEVTQNLRPVKRSPPPTYIRTLRGSQVGQVQVVGFANP